MLSWHALFIALLTIAFIACLGICVIIFLAGGMSDDVVSGRSAAREGRIFGLCALLILAAIIMVQLS